MSGEALAGLPPVNQALEPAWVRHGSAATQKTYATALAFEQMLVQQLSKSLTASTGVEGESSQGSEGSEEGGPSFGTSELSSLLPQALSNGVMSAGGLGLAEQLTRELQSTQGGQSQPVQASGGIAPSPQAGAASITTRGAST